MLIFLKLPLLRYGNHANLVQNEVQVSISHERNILRVIGQIRAL